jgi:hypothetical protein
MSSCSSRFVVQGFFRDFSTACARLITLDVLGLVACLLVLVLYREKLPGEVVGLLSAISGIFGACLRDAHQFEFCSSQSSQVKDQTINKLTGA